MGFHQDFNEFDFPRFVQGQYLKITLTTLPSYAEERIYIMVPYLIQSDILESILAIAKNIEIRLLTRSYKGYLPTIKSGVTPAMNKLKKMKNLKIFISNKIHAKIWLIDKKFAIVHSMNGTPYSENFNFEAGIVSVDPKLIDEIYAYFAFVESESENFF